MWEWCMHRCKFVRWFVKCMCCMQGQSAGDDGLYTCRWHLLMLLEICVCVCKKECICEFHWAVLELKYSMLQLMHKGKQSKASVHSLSVPPPLPLPTWKKLPWSVYCWSHVMSVSLILDCYCVLCTVDAWQYVMEKWWHNWMRWEVPCCVACKTHDHGEEIMLFLTWNHARYVWIWQWNMCRSNILTIGLECANYKLAQ